MTTEKPEDYVMDFQIEKSMYEQFREVQGWQWVRTIVYITFLFNMYDFMTSWAYKDAQLGQAYSGVIKLAQQCREEVASGMNGFVALYPSCEVRIGDTQIINYGKPILNYSNIEFFPTRPPGATIPQGFP